MSSAKPKPERPVLPGESRDQRPNIGILLRAPFEELVTRITDGLHEAGFDDIRPAHTAVFQHIKAEGSRLSELAERAQLTKQSMGYLVDYLEERGYVERQADPTDRRATLILLTERGWAEVRAALQIIAAVEQDWAKRLGTRRIEQLRGLLTDLARTHGPELSHDPAFRALTPAPDQGLARTTQPEPSPGEPHGRSEGHRAD